MKPKPKNEARHRFLYRVWLKDSKWVVLRHLIVKQGPKRIVIRPDPFDEFSEVTRRTKPLVYLDRDEFERSGSAFRIPFGRLYISKEAARFEVEIRALEHLEAQEVDSDSRN